MCDTRRRRSTKTHLALLRSPLAVGVPVKDNLVRAGVPDFGGGVRQSTVSGPFDLVTSRLLHEERLGAAGVSVVVDALFDVVVEDRAGCDVLVCR